MNSYKIRKQLKRIRQIVNREERQNQFMGILSKLKISSDGLSDSNGWIDEQEASRRIQEYLPGKWWNNQYVVNIGAGVFVLFISFVINKLCVPEKKSKLTTEDVLVEQKAKKLDGVVGMEISSLDKDIKMGSVVVKQVGDTLKNTTGVKINLSDKSGEMKLQDKWEIDQGSNDFKGTLTIDPSIGEVILNKRE